MNTRNQNRRPRSPFSKKGGHEEVHGFKRRKIGGERMVTSSGACSGREALGVLTNISDAPPAHNLGGNDFPDCSGIEFTMEEVDALLNTKIKTKKFDIKEKMKQTLEHSCKLKLCIKWFQERDKKNLLDKENIQNHFDSAAKKWNDAELDMEAKISGFNDIISELKKSNASLEEKLEKERLDKLDAIESYKKEKHARLVVEKLQTSLMEEVEKAKQENTAANQKITSLNNTYKSLQEYNTSLQQYNTKLQTDLAKSCESHKMVETEKLSVVESLCTVRTHYNSLQEQHSSCKISLDAATKQQDALVHEISCLRGELKQVRDDRDLQVKQVQSLNLAFSSYKESMATSIAELNTLMTKAKELEHTCSSQREQIRILENQLSSERAKFKMADMSVYETRIEFEAQNRTICELQNRVKESEHKITEGEKLRKMLHNTILELKGNIRVFCRVRPLLPEDCASTDPAAISYPLSTEAVGRGIDLMQSGQKYPFMFDKVFSHEASQDDVFVEISQLVQSALDGYKVCIFAYGQTGSGKTYTMMGEPQVPEQKGLIPRSLEQIFEISQSLCAQGWKYKMQASILEIYNETVRDLLSVNRVETNRSENGVSGKLYSIKHDASGNTSVSDLNIVDVCSIKEISSLLQKAAQSRSVGKTQMNEHSSRSHFVFTLRISGVNEVTGQHLQGVLNLIDLAGSERLSRSGATGDRLKEAQAINKSLSSLSDVIFALAKKEDHVPFRNSKLTYLLQPCLGGDSKVLMFVNISPDSPSFGESLCSLRFAARVNSCEIGIPRRQMAIKLPESRLSTG